MAEMARRRLRRRAGGIVGLVAALLVIPVAPASAHPLGNFTINHYNGLKLSVDEVRNLAVIDAAELPTLQERDIVDTDQDGETSTAERQAFAQTRCESLAPDLVLRVDGATVPWTVEGSRFDYRPGVAGLDISRLECSLVAPVDLTQPASVSFEDRYLSDRLGWREITAAGDGVNLGDREVSTESVSDELRSYPRDLLSSPLDQRSVDLQTRPGVDAGSGNLPELSQAGPVAKFLAGMTATLDGLVGTGDLTLGVGLLALLLSLVLGVSHAALPGHGKTLMAAYMVGTRGSPKDAVIIAGTVTLTHTAGVLTLGLLFSASASFAGETVLAVLGVISGLLVAGIGVALVRGALRRRHRGQVDELWGHGHGHGHGAGHGHGHGHGDGGGNDSAGGTVDSSDRRGGDLVAGTVASTGSTAVVEREPADAEPGHQHGHGHGHTHDHEPDKVVVRDDVAPSSNDSGYRRLTLIGMGLAGGLVPSPSALIVLLGAIGLGRTVFGVALVIGYGIGMAVTLTTVGYLIAKLPGRLGRLRRISHNRWIARLTTAAPILTAALVLAVGVGLALRSAAPLV
ncbi:MAG: High-affinity nickel-transporter [Actinomycetota bacterium]|nr:High-affinity nickel-transporter [Actinomycetota bacterium]